MWLGAVWVRVGAASSSTATAESGIRYIRRFKGPLLYVLPTSPQIVTKRKRLVRLVRILACSAWVLYLHNAAVGGARPTVALAYADAIAESDMLIVHLGELVAWERPTVARARSCPLLAR